MEERWVFGYGSLMWRPGFPFVNRQAATLYGCHRSFCMYTVHSRGTPDQPGLMIGLAPGGATRGVAFRVNMDDWADTYTYLLGREMPTSAYCECDRKIRLEAGCDVKSLVFVSNTNHPQWAGDLPIEEKCKLIADAKGVCGSNIDYLVDLANQLKRENICDGKIEDLLAEMLQM